MTELSFFVEAGWADITLTSSLSLSQPRTVLAKHKDKQLGPAGKVLDILFSVILFYYPIKSFLWQKLDQLYKYIRSGVHIALRVGLGQFMKSNVDVGLVLVSRCM